MEWDRGIAVVIPCYKVTRQILVLLAEIGPEVDRIYCVDDACPDGSGDLIERSCSDPRVVVLRNRVNTGVGGAVMHGYRRAVADGATVIVKLDGDGQMDPALIEAFVSPILGADADYTKGNRFFDLREIKSMPLLRRIGNLGLSFMAKASTGYWDLFDPTNGYTAIHAEVARRLPYDSISSRYFFESDILFRLNVMRAKVLDVPMDARYGDEISGLKVSKIVGEFLAKHVRNTSKRIIYGYFLRDMNIASFELLVAVPMIVFGVAFGLYHWIGSVEGGLITPLGTIMLAALPLVLGVQLLLAFLSHDTAAMPRHALHRLLLRYPAARPAANGM
ncbi:TPA: glycosyltransferase [Stenotrophomonas maltophilia]|uniref:Glycosyl transferase family 2 n=2 Tax=Lysobacteraceae TaxID=32033 RepID=A0A246I7H6_STEMA|nr:glycosyltransferase [Stenotrophomonas maltophilia]CRR78318.1 glycosyltransferase [Pseudomonas aeruginosa]MBA0227892.1 glycosyltransferase [Stenotrophomonas maltophilia]MBA0367686.1 glycosyltransferase [Stenotrophomonas maltophilia]MBA0401866.1 glycosyltransferase [Stenotrophomonas maltophilia]MBA0405785.1 glycosyltransferase [Stenotrophomonas maltophilia]